MPDTHAELFTNHKGETYLWCVEDQELWTLGEAPFSGVEAAFEYCRELNRVQADDPGVTRENFSAMVVTDAQGKVHRFGYPETE